MNVKQSLQAAQADQAAQTLQAATLASILSDYDGDAEYALEEAQENKLDAMKGLQAARASLKNARAFMNWQIETFRGVSQAFRDSLGACVKECNRLDALASNEGNKVTILQGLHYVGAANDAMHKRYCKAVAVSVGKGSMSNFKRWLITQYALLNKLCSPASIHADVQAGIVSSLGANLLLEMRKAELAHLDIVEARASLRECSEVDHALWQWINKARKEGACLSVSVCNLGKHEELEKLYAHAYVMHKACGNIAISKEEKAKVKAYYQHDAHPYADHDSTVVQAYCHDETGAKVIAAFPKRPVVAVKNSKRRATLAPVVDIAP